MAATLSINGYLQMCVRIMCFGLINCLYEHRLASTVTQLTMLTSRPHRKEEAKHNFYNNMLGGGGALKLNVFFFGSGCAMCPNTLAWSWMCGNDPTLTLIGGGSIVVASKRPFLGAWWKPLELVLACKYLWWMLLKSRLLVSHWSYGNKLRRSITGGAWRRKCLMSNWTYCCRTNRKLVRFAGLHQ